MIGEKNTAHPTNQPDNGHAFRHPFSHALVHQMEKRTGPGHSCNSKNSPAATWVSFWCSTRSLTDTGTS